MAQFIDWLQREPHRFPYMSVPIILVAQLFNHSCSIPALPSPSSRPVYSPASDSVFDGKMQTGSDTGKALFSLFEYTLSVIRSVIQALNDPCVADTALEKPMDQWSRMTHHSSFCSHLFSTGGGGIFSRGEVRCVSGDMQPLLMRVCHHTHLDNAFFNAQYVLFKKRMAFPCRLVPT